MCAWSFHRLILLMQFVFVCIENYCCFFIYFSSKENNSEKKGASVEIAAILQFIFNLRTARNYGDADRLEHLLETLMGIFSTGYLHMNVCTYIRFVCVCIYLHELLCSCMLMWTVHVNVNCTNVLICLTTMDVMFSLNEMLTHFLMQWWAVKHFLKVESLK